MKKYIVEGQETVYYRAVIEAVDEKEAEDIFRNMELSAYDSEYFKVNGIGEYRADYGTNL